MAITGSGTQEDPFVIEEYADFDGCHGSGYGDSPTWVVLSKDIDCNDYGPNFVWSTILLYGSSVYGESAMHVDLCGHAIKNVLVAPNQSMFDFKGGSELKNGKILNVFLSGAAGLFRGRMNPRNLSISINATGATEEIVKSLWSDPSLIQNCSFYIESYSLAGNIFSFVQASEPMNNCDIEIHIDDLNERALFGKPAGYGGLIASVSDCRITGKVAGRPQAYNGMYRAVLSTQLSALNRSCVDVDFSGTWGESDHSTWTIDKIITGDLNGTVVNQSHGTAEWRAGGMYSDKPYLVSDAEIVIGADLRDHQFVVANLPNNG